MTNVPDITYRFSNIDDYEAICVLSLSAGIEPGVDYVQESYPELLKDPLFYGALAECDGEVIGFSAVMIQMEGTKLFSRSGRVKLEWRNRGIFGKLKKFIQRSLRESTYPQLQFEEFGTHDTNPALQRVIDNPNYTEIYRKPYLTFAHGEATLSTVNPDSCVHDIGIEGLRRMMKDATLCSLLLTPRVFVGLVNFEPQLSEIELMVKYNPLILASYVKDEHDISEISIGVLVTSILYFISWVPRKLSEDQAGSMEVYEHFKRHFLRMKEIMPNGSCQISFPRGYEQIVKEAARSLSLIELESWASENMGFRTECV